MEGAKIIIGSIEKHGVDRVFGHPGGAVLPLYEALRNSSLTHVLTRTEQGAAHAASGYARMTGKPGVCIVTSGPGATNIITGIATAQADSVPLVVITGQVQRDRIGTDAFQEADIAGASEPFTKHTYLVQDAADLPRIMNEAFHIASTGRPGPVLVDIPVDVQKEDVQAENDPSINIRGYKPVFKGNRKQIKAAIAALEKSERPLICAGGGILCSGSRTPLNIFLQKTGIPVVHTLMGNGAVDMDLPNVMGMIGSHGHLRAKQALKESDLLIIIGARISDRATAGGHIFEREKIILHIDIDPAEVGKNIETHIPIVGDAGDVLIYMLKHMDFTKTWDWKPSRTPSEAVVPMKSSPDRLDPAVLLHHVSEKADSDAIFTADVGLNQIWAARHITMSGKRRFLTSGGLGTMGYGLPSAIGAKMAAPERQVFAVMGDGGIQMSLGELGTLSESGEKVVILLLNNQYLGMVRELQDNAYGVDCRHGVYFKKGPDFVQIAEAYGLKSAHAYNMESFGKILEQSLCGQDSWLIDCRIDPKINSVRRF
ncbi:MAG: biosynthetic-type acetolactate synthase large subunit [Peptostreptococcaceae bacterium]|nr:biosynthetic-type acetolactate synthase large subunit [Peptostreptococcaceae bacterium]